MLAGFIGIAGGIGLDAGVGQVGGTPAAPFPNGTGSSAPVAGLLPRLDRPMNVLVMASDVNYEVRDGKRALGLRGNTDTMILVRFDPGLDAVRMLSIPRDTRVPIPGHGTFKINAANPYGGADLAVETVSRFLDLPVDRFVLINTRAVIQLVDALGGVEVFVPRNLDYDDWTGHLHIHLQKGPNKLDGQRAHDFLRFRHDGQGDIGRVQRQQAFLQAALRQYLTPASLLKTPRLLGMATDNLQTNLSAEDVVKLAGWSRSIGPERVQMAMVPGREDVIAGGWYWVPDETRTRELVERFLIGATIAQPVSPFRLRITLRDGVGDRRACGRLAIALERAGFPRVEREGLDPEQGRAETQIIAQNADEEAGRAVQQALGVGRVVVAATGSLGADVTVVMGRDWVAETNSRAGPQR